MVAFGAVTFWGATVCPASAQSTPGGDETTIEKGTADPFVGMATPKPSGLTHSGPPLPQKVEMKFTKKTTHAKKHPIRPASPLKTKEDQDANSPG